ncbi:MAG: prepilin-type N-terminal cleavage/methylation domain-containing protein [Gammaproteobacteria bacterium]|nr:prepilin-type N-terminal cleavage/methylation domain-containing protein [Gammaproteobacteria bacterium]
MQKQQSGFTLIELMVVVAIIGLLAAIAVPQYTNYIQRTKLGSAVQTALAWKTAISLCIQDNGIISNVTCGILVDVGANEVNYVGQPDYHRQCHCHGHLDRRGWR